MIIYISLINVKKFGQILRLGLRKNTFEKLPHSGAHAPPCPMDPINPFISVNHVPMEGGTRREKNFSL